MVIRRKVCKNCGRLIITEKECPICKEENFSEKYKGRVLIIDPKKSEIAKRLEIKYPGNYAIKH